MRRTCGSFSAVVVVLALVSAWIAPLTLGREQTSGIEIAGRVVDAGGKPIAAAEVGLLAYPTRYSVRQAWSAAADLPRVAKTKTGQDGRFTLRAPEPGLWMLSVRAARHAENLVYVVPLVRQLELLDIALPKVRPLRVRVTGPDGLPVAGATVLALPDRHTTGSRGAARRSMYRPSRQRTLLRGRVAQTDAEGWAQVHAVADRVTTLKVVADGFLLAEKDHRAGAEVEVSLRAGARRTIEVRSAAGTAVADALLVVDSRSPPIATTDQTGRATVVVPANSELAKQPLSVIAYAPGGGRGTLSIVPAKGEAAKKSLRLTLSAPNIVRGIVVDSVRREPIAGAVVWSGVEDQVSTRSDARGGFLLRVAGDAPWVSAGAVGYLTAGSRAGDEQSTTLVLAAAGRLPGRVVDAHGEPLAGVVLRISHRMRPGRRSQQVPAAATTNEQGGFELAPVPTNVGLTVVAKRKGFAPAEVESMVASDGAVEPLEIILLAGRHATGLVVDTADQPLAGATVSLAGTPSEQQTIFAFARRQEQEALESVTDGEGRFRFDDLGPGRFVLRVVRQGYAPITVPGVTVPDITIPGSIVEEGDSVVDFGTIVMLDGAVLEGLVVDQDGAPISEVSITVSERAGSLRFLARRSMPPKVISGVDGRFSMPDLRPDAPVDIHASADGYAATKVANVMVPAEEPVRVEMSTGIDLRGVVVDARGGGIEKAMVMAMLGGSISQERRMGQVSDAEGSFLVESLIPGDWSLTVSAEGFQTREVPKVTVTAGEVPRPVRIQLDAGATLIGRVTGADGTALRDVYVSLRQTAQERMRTFRSNGVGTDGEGRYRLGGLPSGRHAISFSHERHRSLVRDIEVGTAEQTLDVTLEAGLEIAGRVVDSDGTPVAGAMVSASTADVSNLRRFYGGGTRETDTRGEFRLEGLGPGSFHVTAAKDGFASVVTETPVEVAGSSVEGIELRFTAGGTVLGTVRGVAFDDLASVTVMAMRIGGGALGQPQIAGVDHEGHFEMVNLSVGDWQIYASVGQRAEREVIHLPSEGAEVRVDLDFGSGFTLTGMVLERGTPVPGLMVNAQGIDTRSAAQETTSPRGRFTLRGLEAGRYELSVSRPGRHGRPLARQQLDVQGDDDVVIEVTSVVVTGRVVEAVGSLPISGAAIQVTRDEDHSPMTLSPWRGRDAVSGDDGAFRIAEMAPGSYRLHVEKEGFAAGVLSLEVAADMPPASVEVALERSAGVRLEVVLPNGLPARDVSVAVLDPTGQPILVGNFIASASGTIEVDQVPTGRWTLWVGGAGAATARVEAQVPGPPVRLTLAPAGRLLLRVPAAREVGQAYVSLADAQGKMRIVGSYGSLSERWALAGGTTTIAPLPPGPLEVTVAMPDGSELRGTATVLANQVVEVEIR